MIKRIFITGLAALIPIVLTVYVIANVFVFADGILGKYVNQFSEQYFGATVPGVGIILSIIIIFLTGLLFHLSRMRLLKVLENAFFHFPLVNKIYSPIRRMVNFLFFPPHQKFQRVVLVEYPRKGIYSLGFLTRESASHFEEKTGKKLFNVFIPNSPTPVSGFTIIVTEDQLTVVDITVEEAVKLVVSGGLVNPGE